MNGKLVRRRRKCGGAITVATEGMVIEVGSDNIRESERIVKSMLESLKEPKKQVTYIR